MMFVRAYLRASTVEQDASRAKAQLEQFATERRLVIASYYVENESGASLKRPELFRLLNDCQTGDVLLIEQVDRLSRLNDADWEALKQEIQNRGVRIVALDLPTSWQSIHPDETTSRIMQAVNAMLLEKAKVEGRYTGRKANLSRNAAILNMLERGDKWSEIQAATGCSRSTISRIKGTKAEQLTNHVN